MFWPKIVFVEHGQNGTDGAFSQYPLRVSSVEGDIHLGFYLKVLNP